MAIVLAAGQGTRMGGPKALMRVEGHLWWEVQRDRLAAAGVPAVWVVNERVERVVSAAPPGPLVLADEAAPMLASIIAGLARLAASGEPLPSGIFVLPVDVPAPSMEVWTALSESGADVAAPVFGGGPGHPVYLAWRWVGEVLIPSAAASKHARLDELMRGVVRGVPVSDRDVRVNLNTPQVLEDWLSTRPAPRKE